MPTDVKIYYVMHCRSEFKNWQDSFENAFTFLLIAVHLKLNVKLFFAFRNMRTEKKDV